MFFIEFKYIFYYRRFITYVFMVNKVNKLNIKSPIYIKVMTLHS